MPQYLPWTCCLVALTGWLATLLFGVLRLRAVAAELDRSSQEAQRSREQASATQGRCELLEASHRILSRDLTDARNLAMSLSAELAQERSVRVNLEAALGSLQERARTHAAHATKPAPVQAPDSDAGPAPVAPPPSPPAPPWPDVATPPPRRTESPEFGNFLRRIGSPPPRQP